MKKISFTLFCSFFIFFLAQAQTAQEGIELTGKSLFGDLSARQIGPAVMSGRVTDLEGHPENSRILYVGSAGGGVWKSEDGGVTYSSVFDEYCQSIGDITLDPSHPDKIVWVGTGETWTRNSTSVGDGLYKSTDGGQNWKKMGFENSERISSILVHPDSSDIIHVGVLGPLWGESKDRGVYESKDGGDTWEQIFSVDDPHTGCSDLIRHPSDPDVLYALFWEFERTAWSFNSGGTQSALYKSIDGGESWEKVVKDLPSGKMGRLAMAIAPSNPDIHYLVVEAENKEEKGLYKSVDNGVSWTHVNKDFELTVRPFYFSRLVVSPHDPDFICKAGVMGGLSYDGGLTFRSVGSGVHADIHDFWFDLKDKDKIFLGCDGGVYRTYDGGTAWDMVNGLPLSQYYHIALDYEEPFNIYGGLQDNGSWIGPSAAIGGVSNREWTRVGYGDGFRVYPHPEDPNTVYSEMQGAENVWRVDIASGDAKVIKPYAQEDMPKLRFNWNAPIMTSLHEPDRLYIGSQFLHRSDDRGESWTVISPDLTTDDASKQNQEDSGGLSKDNSGAENHCTIFTIAESPLDDKLLWVGTDDGQLQITRNDGEEWTNLTSNIPDLPPNTWIYHIEASSHQAGRAYIVCDGHTQNDWTPYVYRTDDYGQTWVSIASSDIYGFARSIQEDYENPDVLYLGTEFGLYITIDGGVHWSRFENNFPAVAVHHVELHPREHSLVCGTHGRGIIIIDDVRPLRELTNDIVERGIHFFDFGTQVLKDPATFGGGYTTFDEFIGPNPSSQVQISYFLQKRHIFGKMAMHVLDEDGNVIQELSPGKSKGINVVTWDGRHRPPKVAKAKTLSFDAVAAPRVPSGTYKIVMQKGKEKYTTSVTIANAPSKLHTEEDRLLQYKAAMELYRLNEDMAYMIDQLNTIDAKAKEILKMDASGKIIKELQQIVDFNRSFQADMVQLEGDNYVGQVEPKLRERIGSLYGDLAGYVGRPSLDQLRKKDLIMAEYSEAESQWKQQMDRVKSLNEMLLKKGLEPIRFTPKDEFLGKAIKS